MSRRTYSDCCHYDDGYDDGFDDGKTAAAGAGDEPLRVAELLLRAARALYAADALSLLAHDCERAAIEIAAETGPPSAIAHLEASARRAA